MGIVETFGVRFAQLKRDEEGDTRLQHPDRNVGFLIALIVIWVAAMIAGNVLFELGKG